MWPSWVRWSAGGALVAIGVCASSVERQERAAPASPTPAAPVQRTSRVVAGCGAAAGLCNAAVVKPDASVDIRAVLADPSVKGFIGLAENAWNFAKPDDVPGFGPLAAEEAKRLVLRMTNRNVSAAFDPSSQYAALPSVRLTEKIDTAVPPPKRLE